MNKLTACGTIGFQFRKSLWRTSTDKGGAKQLEEQIKAGSLLDAETCLHWNTRFVVTLTVPIFVSIL